MYRGKINCNHVFQKAVSPSTKQLSIPKSRLIQSKYSIYLLFLREIDVLILCPYNAGIEDESINHALRDIEVEGTDEEHQQESCSCKENEECQVVVAGAVDAVGKSNSQAVVFLAAPHSLPARLKLHITIDSFCRLICFSLLSQ